MRAKQRHICAVTSESSRVCKPQSHATATETAPHHDPPPCRRDAGSQPVPAPAPPLLHDRRVPSQRDTPAGSRHTRSAESFQARPRGGGGGRSLVGGARWTDARAVTSLLDGRQHRAWSDGRAESRSERRRPRDRHMIPTRTRFGCDALFRRGGGGGGREGLPGKGRVKGPGRAQGIVRKGKNRN